MKHEDLLEYLDARIKEIKYTETDHDHSLVLLGGRMAFQEIKKYIKDETEMPPNKPRLYRGIRKE
ncbi:hypothetical protein ACE1TI_21550 [Alteribacillus sp. JSM 102045]|uniref:hypothetical protein n=1 Tax=Alteribacillus sp. JSM 102045 TaxID=1562101 RepID=UPI0035BEDA20